MSAEAKDKQVSRRNFLKGAASVAGVTLLSGAGGLLLAGCSGTQATAAEKAPEWPFPYKKLDPEKAAERAYKAYKEAG